MNGMEKLIIIVAITTFLVTSFLILDLEFHSWTIRNDFNHTEKVLNISNLTSNVYFDDNSDQYGNALSQSYKYHVYADIYSIDLSNNYTVQIKAYDSKGNYLEEVSSNRSLSSLNSISEGSGRNLDYNYYSDELIDYSYAIFEIYDDNNVLVYNQTAIFNLNNITAHSSIDYIGGQIW